MSSTLQTDTTIPAHILEAVTAHLGYQDLHGWVPWAWAALARAGDVPALDDEDHENYPDCLFTLAALGHLFELFQQVAAGGDADLEPDIDLLDEVRPQITPIELARYCERTGIYDTELQETGTGLLREAISDRAAELRGRLSEILGEARLFTSLFAAGGAALEPDGADRSAPIGRPMAEDAFDPFIPSVVNADLTDDKQRAYAWLAGDLDLG